MKQHAGLADQVTPCDESGWMVVAGGYDIFGQVNHRPSGTEPPVDQLAQFSLAQVMAPRVGSERHGGIPQSGEVVRRLLDECDRPVAVLLTRGYPGVTSP